MQRLKDERGAVAVVVALLMVPLLGFAAISIDVSAMYAQRQQLQTGADAGALAIAQACKSGACGATAQTAQSYSTANLNSGTATATVTSLTSSSVTVKNSGVSKHLFAPILGVKSTPLSRSATVSWGTPTGGTAMLPLTFSWCEWQAQTGGGLPSTTTERVILFPKSSGTGCTGPSGHFVPGGFGWVDVNAGTCNRLSDVAGVLSKLESDPGDSPPSSCSAVDFAKVQNKTVLLPLFVDYGGTGTNAYYRVYGYAAFKVTGYFFGGPFNWGSPCSGNDRCIRGYFTRLLDRDAAFTYGSGSPELGAGLISLTK